MRDLYVGIMERPKWIGAKALGPAIWKGLFGIQLQAPASNSSLVVRTPRI